MGYDFSGHEAFVIAEATKREQERIIRLIDGRICFDHRTDNNCDHGQCWALHDLKALIQGVDLHEE